MNPRERKFWREFWRLYKVLGLTDWRVDPMPFDGDENTNGRTQVDWNAHAAAVMVNPNVDDPLRTAKHEIGHLLLGEMRCLASRRNVTEAQLDDAWETVSRRLERVL
jgi:hypothetical protein